jgi:hypothetical protein
MREPVKKMERLAVEAVLGLALVRELQGARLGHPELLAPELERQVLELQAVEAVLGRVLLVEVDQPRALDLEPVLGLQRLSGRRSLPLERLEPRALGPELVLVQESERYFQALAALRVLLVLERVHRGLVRSRALVLAKVLAQVLGRVPERELREQHQDRRLVQQLELRRQHRRQGRRGRCGQHLQYPPGILQGSDQRQVLHRAHVGRRLKARSS